MKSITNDIKHSCCSRIVGNLNSYIRLPYKYDTHSIDMSCYGFIEGFAKMTPLILSIYLIHRKIYL